MQALSREHFWELPTPADSSAGLEEAWRLGSPAVCRASGHKGPDPSAPAWLSLSSSFHIHLPAVFS